MPILTDGLSCAPGSAAIATVWLAPMTSDLDALKPLLDAGPAVRVVREGATELSPAPPGLAADPRHLGPAATLLRRSVFLSPAPVRPFFAVCAVESWRRVPVRQLAAWSGIPFHALKRRLGATSLTPAGVAAWNLTLHATWLLDVAELPATTVTSWMRLGRPAALANVLGGRGVRFAAGIVDSGAFAATLNRYLAVLHDAFGV